VTCIPETLVREAEQMGILEDRRQRSAGTEVTDSFLQLCRAADQGHQGAVDILNRAAARTARAVSVLANMLDVESVIFGGPFWEPLARRYLEMIPASLAEFRAARSIHPVTVVATTIGEDVAAIGAACLVLESTLGPRSDRLLLGE
jgi:predicted NBD/HSP70 family sugar kinase